VVLYVYGHELAVKGGFDHETYLALSLGNKNFKRLLYYRIAAFPLPQKVADLGTLSVSDNYSLTPS
jgi:hypothetical protein